MASIDGGRRQKRREQRKQAGEGRTAAAAATHFQDQEIRVGSAVVLLPVFSPARLPSSVQRSTSLRSRRAQRASVRVRPPSDSARRLTDWSMESLTEGALSPLVAQSLGVNPVDSLPPSLITRVHLQGKHRLAAPAQEEMFDRRKPWRTSPMGGRRGSKL